MEDYLGNRTTTVYDDADRVIASIDHYGQRTTFVYDSVGRQIATVDPFNNRSTTVYDNAGRVSASVDPYGNRTTFVYDDAGRQTVTIDPYSQRRSGIAMTFILGAMPTQRVGMRKAGSFPIELALSARDRVNRNELKSVVRSDVEVGPAQIVRTSYAYDAVGRMTNLHHRDNSGASISNFTYTYDAASRVTTEVTNGTTKTYTYDNTDQLTADGTVTVTYDANGNRNNGSYTTGTGNQITGDGTWAYTYDAEGNMTKKSQGASAETWTYGYDQRNQLLWAEKRATDGGTLQMRADYKYDMRGNRIQKAVDSDGDTDIDTTERYAYDGWKTGPQTQFVGNENWDIVADLDGSSSLTTRYLRGDVIDQIFARTDAGSNEAYWLLTDRLGSLRNVVDDTQAVKDNIAYDGFGNVISESDAAYGGRYKLTGREVDVETELQYNRARYYDGKIGRWISRDPLGYEAGDSNLYRYVANAVTQSVDPSGLDFIAVGNLSLAGVPGLLGAGHFSIAAFKSNVAVLPSVNQAFVPHKNPFITTLSVYFAPVGNGKIRFTRLRDTVGGLWSQVISPEISAVQYASIGMIPSDGWFAKFKMGAGAKTCERSVSVSVIGYDSDSAHFFTPIFEGTPGQAKNNVEEGGRLGKSVSICRATRSWFQERDHRKSRVYKLA